MRRDGTAVYRAKSPYRGDFYTCPVHEARYPGATMHAYRGIKRSYHSCYLLPFWWFCSPGRPSDRNYMKKFQPG